MPAVERAFRSYLRSALCSSLAALSLYLAFPPATLWPCAFLAPILLLVAVRAAPSWKSCALIVTVTHMPVFAAMQWWIIDVSALGLPAFIVYLSVCWGLLSLLLRALDACLATRTLHASWVLPLGYLSSEFLRGDLVCGGYPWFFAGHPLVQSAFLSQCADLLGAATLSALVCVISGSTLDAIVALRRADRRGAMLALSVTVLAWLSALLYGAARLQQYPPTTPSNASSILIVQTSVPTSNKLAWSPQAQVDDTQRGMLLTLEGVRNARAEGEEPILAVWPETMLPGFGLELDGINAMTDAGAWPGSRFADAAKDLVQATGVPLLVGSAAYEGLHIEGEGTERHYAWNHQYNSVYLVQDAMPYPRYDKIFLTPFGETMPVISAWPWLESNLLALGAEGMTFDLDAGGKYTRFTVASKHSEPLRIATPICFEDSVGWVCRRMVFGDRDWQPWSATREADLLIAPSNDGWFGSSASSRAQHFDFARLRAIEFRTPVLRSVNTGFSAWIDEAGRIRAVIGASPRGEMNLEGSLLARVQPLHGVPLSARTADLLSWGSVLCCVVIFFRSSRTSRPDQ